MTVATRAASPPRATEPATQAAVPTAGRTLKALVRRGVLDGRRAPLTWGLGLGLLSALTAALYPAIDDTLAEAIKSYPEGMKEALGIEDLTTVEAYLDMELFNLVVPLTAAFFAIRAAARAIVGREERGELDTLLAAPVRRELLVAGALVVTAVLTAAVLVVTGALLWVGAAIAGADLGIGSVAAGLTAAWSLALVFAGLTLLCAGALRRSGVVTGIAGATLVAMYVLDAVGKASDDLEWLRWASVFRWYGSAVREGLDVAATAGLVGGGVLLAVLGALLFTRRDLRT
jgi:ABC-2 type transport system permease protein